jgi:hypothetical protein
MHHTCVTESRPAQAAGTNSEHKLLQASMQWTNAKLVASNQVHSTEGVSLGLKYLN